MTAIVPTEIRLAHLEALLMASTEITVQEPPCVETPSVVLTDEDWLSAIKVVSWLTGKKAQAATAEYAQTERRQRQALEAKAADTEKLMTRILDLADPGPEPQGGFAKLKAQPAKAAAEDYYKSLLYIGERIAEALHG